MPHREPSGDQNLYICMNYCDSPRRFGTRIAFLTLLLFYGLAGFAQSPRNSVSASFKDASLVTILNYISGSTDYSISYDDDVRTDKGVYTVSFDRSPVESALKSLLAKSPFTFSVNGRQIKVFKLQSGEGQSQTGKKYRAVGKVVDAKGEPLPQATVRVKGKNEGILADLDGNFDFPVSSEKGDLVISMVGFTSKTVAYASGKTQTVTLKEDAKTLGEVSVIAYGTKNTRELTGAISSLKGEKLQDVPSPSIQNLLQGHMAGVEVTNLSGAPGGNGSQVTIRGFSSLNTEGINDGSPLYVIDGVPVYSQSGIQTGGVSPLASLDPSTIESVEVLKDAASAAMYGSRAGNGVILITTKKGKTGRADISVNLSQSVTWLPKTPVQMMGNAERVWHLYAAKNRLVGNYDWTTDEIVIPKNHDDAYGWDPLYGGAYDWMWNNGKRRDDFSTMPGILTDSLNTFYNNKTNWWKYMFRTGRVTDASITATGGNDNVRYMINGGIYDETGIMIGSSFRRISFNNNLDINLSPTVQLYSRLSLAYTNMASGTDMGKVQGLTIDPKQTSTLLPGKGTEIEALTLRQLQDIDQKNMNYNLRLNAGIKWDIIKGLTLNSSVAINHFVTSLNIFMPDYLMWDKRSQVDNTKLFMTTLQTENLLTYKLNLDSGHNLDLLCGMTYNTDVLNSTGGTATGGPTNQIKYVGDGWPELKKDEYGTVSAAQKFQTNFEEQAMLSFLGRASYNYKQKYLLDLSVRYDGSSVFGRNVRWGVFPAAGLGWAFSEEDFMKDVWWIDFGKLRASWGRSGQKFQNAYLALGIMGTSNIFFGNAGLKPEILANKDLTWEKSDQYDFGVDLEMLNYRLKLTLDYYYKYSYALLMQTPMPGNVYYVDKMWNNSSAISNEGIEATLTADIIRTDDFRWQMMFNVSRNWNLFRESFDGHDLEKMILGRPLYGIYTFKDEGIVQKEEDIPYYYNSLGIKRPLMIGGEGNLLQVGARKIADLNQDGKIDENDRYYAGSTIPLAYGGWSNQLTWKGLTLFAHFNYSIGRKVMNQVRNAALSFNKNFGVVMEDYSKVSIWEKPGDVADFPAIKFADNSYVGQYDGDIDSNIENVSFIRLKQLTLSYDMPGNWMKKIHLKGIRLSLTGENLFAIHNYSGTDPEIISPYTGIDDGSTYPLNTQVTLGLNLRF